MADRPAVEAAPISAPRSATTVLAPGVKERAAEHGVRIAVETQAMGHDIIQLHPLDVDVAVEEPAAMAATWAVIIGLEPPRRPRAASPSRSAAAPSGSCPPPAAVPASSPSTSTPPTAPTSQASKATSATPSSASSKPLQ